MHPDDILAGRLGWSLPAPLPASPSPPGSPRFRDGSQAGNSEAPPERGGAPERRPRTDDT